MRTAYANKTYEAERGYWAGLPPGHPARRQVTLEEAQAVVDRHLAGWRVTRGNGFKNGACYWHEDRISIGGLAQQWIVLHEVAHALGPRKHDAAFRAAYASLVRAEHGDEVADGLLEAFGSLRLKVS